MYGRFLCYTCELVYLLHINYSFGRDIYEVTRNLT